MRWISHDTFGSFLFWLEIYYYIIRFQFVKSGNIEHFRTVYIWLQYKKHSRKPIFIIQWFYYNICCLIIEIDFWPRAESQFVFFSDVQGLCVCGSERGHGQYLTILTSCSKGNKYLRYIPFSLNKYTYYLNRSIVTRKCYCDWFHYFANALIYYSYIWLRR